MPSWSRPIVVDGVVVGRACGRSPFHPCVTCGKSATIRCDHPVTRNGKPKTCDRWCCRGCAVSVGPDRDYCAAHAREAKT
jgi:hypothetical protein